MEIAKSYHILFIINCLFTTDEAVIMIYMTRT